MNGIKTDPKPGDGAQPSISSVVPADSTFHWLTTVVGQPARKKPRRDR